MKIVIVSNYINHHVKALCQELYKILGCNFSFIETMTNEDDTGAFKRGYAYYMAGINEEVLPWIIYGWKEKERARQILFDADAVITSNCSDDWILHRLKAKKLTFRAHERWYREPLHWYQFPRAIIGGWLHHGRFSSLYLLSASGYTAADAAKIGCFYGKAYRWGYFPVFRDYTPQQIQSNKCNAVPVILWAGRFVDWKRADDAIAACKILLSQGYEFRLRVAGSGPEEESLRKNAEGLEGAIDFIGLLTPESLRDEMEKSDIFLFTSDFQEGWGVVLNEAMNSSCAVIASHAAGATPYLIDDKVNGLVYPCGNVTAMTDCIRKLLDSKPLRLEMGIQAYRTIQQQWSAEVAANRFLRLCENLIDGVPLKETNGPCSVAPIIDNCWYH